MTDKLFIYLMKLKKEDLLHVMWASLDIMEGYNGQTKTQAIMSAIGAETVEKDGEPQWKMPSIKEASGNVAGYM